MKTFVCSNCRYKTRKEFLPESCNYCGKKGVMKEIESADKIVGLID